MRAVVEAPARRPLFHVRPTYWAPTARRPQASSADSAQPAGAFLPSLGCPHRKAALARRYPPIL